MKYIFILGAICNFISAILVGFGYYEAHQVSQAIAFAGSGFLLIVMATND